jgi:type VI secretion system protein ImpH
MGSTIWRTNRSIEQLLSTPMYRSETAAQVAPAGFEFAFFQTVRLITALSSKRQPVGLWTRPKEEAIRFHTAQSVSFPATEVHSIEKDLEDKFHLTVNFLGLTGFKGLLPVHYTELALDHSGNRALVDFLDLFNHRLISLFYRAWEKHHFAIGYEIAERRGSQEDPFTSYLFNLIGLGSDSLRRRLPVNDRTILPYAGLILQRPHSAVALESMLRDYFGVPVEVRGFQGKWHPLQKKDLCWLDPEGSYNQLGRGAIAGDEVWVQQAKFMVSVGPLSLEQFRDFLPNGTRFQEAAGLIRFFTDRALDFDLQPILKAEEVPLCQTGSHARSSPRLGWSTWLKATDLQSDMGDAVFHGPDFGQIGSTARVN